MTNSGRPSASAPSSACSSFCEHEAAVAVGGGVAEFGQRKLVQAGQERRAPCPPRRLSPRAASVRPGGARASPVTTIRPDHQPGQHQRVSKVCGHVVLRAQPLIVAGPSLGDLQILAVAATSLPCTVTTTRYGGVVNVEIALLPGEIRGPCDAAASRWRFPRNRARPGSRWARVRRKSSASARAWRR